MSRADDIDTLFQKFGASTDAYLEMDSSFDYQETSTPAVRAAAAPARSTNDVPAAAAPAQAVKRNFWARIANRHAEPQPVAASAPASVSPIVSAAPVPVETVVPVVAERSVVAPPVVPDEAPVTYRALNLDTLPAVQEQAPDAVLVAALDESAPKALAPVLDMTQIPAMARTLSLSPSLALTRPVVSAPAPVLDVAPTPVPAPARPLQATPVSSTFSVHHSAFAPLSTTPSAPVTAPAPEPELSAQPKAVPAPRIAPAPAPSKPAPLRSLLAEVAKVRQAEAEALNNEALHQAMLKARPPVIQARVIAVVSAKGGVGKSTLCAALANTLALPGGRSIAIELDAQDCLRHHLHATPDRAGLAQGSLRGDNWNDLLLSGSGHAQVLPHGALTATERTAFDQCLDQDMHWLARQIDRMKLNAHDVLVLDVASGPSRLMDQALDVANHVLVVVDTEVSNYLALDAMEQLLEPLAERRLPPVCSYVINRFDGSRPFNLDMYEVLRRRLGERLLGRVRHDYSLAEALAYGVDPLQAEAPTEGVQDLLDLGAWLKARLIAEGVQESRLP